jgi:hypothetical protein
MKRLVAMAVGNCLLVAGCIADIIGAPCETQDTCPSGQYCTAAKRCAPGDSLTGVGVDGGFLVVAPGSIGAPCSADAQCASGWCFTDNPGGECTSECQADAECGPNRWCVDEGDGTSTCYLTCVSATGCRSGYQCSSGICVPQ